MSFDANFNYSPVITGLNAEKDSAVQQLLSLQNEKSSLHGATAYANDPNVASRISQLTVEIAKINSAISSIDAVMAEIAVVNLLSPERKDNLYYLYTLTSVPKQDFMTRILFNHSTPANVEKIAELRADATTPEQTKSIVAKLHYEKNYPITADKARTVMRIFRYIR